MTTEPNPAPTASQVAQDIALTQMKELAVEAFPGITDLRMEAYSQGALREPFHELTGTWHGVTLGIGRTHNVSEDRTLLWAHVAQKCACCGYYESVSSALRDAIDFAHRVKTDAGPEVDFCSACRWLHPVQDQARAARTPWSRWWFEFSRQESIEDVLAAHEAKQHGEPCAAPQPQRPRRTSHAGPSA